MNATLRPALDAWANVVRSEHVIAEGESLRAAESATYKTTERVAARIRPSSASEVAACLKIASEHRVPIYPISRGRNWGFGSRVPTADLSVLLELDRMDAIRDYDEELAHVTVEPGVTQKQLQEFLSERSGGRLWMDTTSSSPHASVIGNLMDRGHGVSPYGDRVANACAFEVALPTGELIRTGYGAFPGAAVEEIDAWGVGPSLDGLFTQSSFGVVTRATFFLMPAPERVEVCFFSASSDEAFERLVDRVRPLRLERTLRAGPFLANMYQSLQKVISYPWKETGGQKPLRPELALELARAHAYDLWNGSIGLYGTHAEVAEQKRRLGAVLDGCASRVRFMGPELTGLEDGFPPSRHREVKSVVFGFTGRTGATSLPQGYWRKGPLESYGAELDLDRDRCGFKFTSIAVPFRGRDVLRMAELARKHILAHGFEPVMGMLPIRERAIHCQISTAYDRDDQEDDARVGACHEELTFALAEAGYYPARLGVGSMNILSRRDPQYAAVLQRLKACFDPRGILAPGRYV